MLNLPKSTEVSKQLPKKAIYASANLNTAEKDAFDENIKKLTIVNEITANSVNIEASENVTGFFVLSVTLKCRSYDKKVIEQLFKLVKQRLLLVLQYEDVAQLAVYHNKLFATDWQPIENLDVQLKGLNLSQVWQNLVLQISSFKLEQGRNLDEQLAVENERAKLRKQIEVLSKKAWVEKQSKKKFALVQELNELKRKLEGL